MEILLQIIRLFDLFNVAAAERKTKECRLDFMAWFLITADQFQGVKISGVKVYTDQFSALPSFTA